MLTKFSVDFGGVNFPLPYRENDRVYVGFTAVFSGCRRALSGNPCPDCQNPSFWGRLDWDGYTHDWIVDYARKKYERIIAINPDTRFFYCVLGGEPLDQDERELIIVHNNVMKGCGRKIPTVLYTGYDTFQASAYARNFADFVKVGAYLGDKHRKTGLSSGLATENQRWMTNFSDELFAFA